MKYDGYRLRVERNGDCVRLITRGGRQKWWIKGEPPISGFRIVQRTPLPELSGN
jgi:hypothetical protein